MLKFLTRTRGRSRLDWTDWLSYAYLFLGLFTMFAPIVWLVMSSFKTESAISLFPPTFLPYSQKSVEVKGHDKPLPLYLTKDAQGNVRPMAQVRRIGIMATMVDPASPGEEIRVNIDDRGPIRRITFAFGTTPTSSASSTSVATVEQRLHHCRRDTAQLLIDSMAAFALSSTGFAGGGGSHPDHRHADDPADDHPGSGVSGDRHGRPVRQPVGRHPAVDRDADRRVLLSPVMLIDPRQLLRGRGDHASEWRIYSKIILRSLHRRLQC